MEEGPYTFWEVKITEITFSLRNSTNVHSYTGKNSSAFDFYQIFHSLGWNLGNLCLSQPSVSSLLTPFFQLSMFSNIDVISLGNKRGSKIQEIWVGVRGHGGAGIE